MDAAAERKHAKVYPRVYGGTAKLIIRRLLGDGSIPACTGEPDCHEPYCSSEPVYPRVYGGTQRGNEVNCQSRGLSPRVRGNHRLEVADRANRRSIPACTGEPRPLGATWACPRVYPRVYGGTVRR